jgi:hypothetical protein
LAGEGGAAREKANDSGSRIHELAADICSVRKISLICYNQRMIFGRAKIF